mmetsp:Transcript_56183/g.147738  ORF Transcript_56183/g.147738 Transcript_56183/m.147738 type:complete len:260 (-) Transcript_56183:52-831(-)
MTQLSRELLYRRAVACAAGGPHRFAQKTFPGFQWPEPHLLFAWLGCLAGFLWWLQEDILTRTDLAVVVAVHVVCLPVISSSTTPRILSCLGGPIMGLVAGMQLIDMCFDLMILRDVPIPDGPDVLQARRMAYFYYHTVISAAHVNAVLLGVILVSFLGALAGFERASSEVRQSWTHLGVLMFAGTGGYLGCVVPRYLGIRSSKAFDPMLFADWEVVVAARLVLYASIILSLPILFRLQGLRDERIEMPSMADYAALGAK